MPYQVMFEADFVEQRHRGTTCFRWLLAIPLFIWGALWLIAVDVVVVIAWFALLFTAPSGCPSRRRCPSTGAGGSSCASRSQHWGLAVSYFGFATVLAVVGSAPLVHWIVIVNDGRARQSLQRVTWVYNAFSIRVTAWAFLIAQDLPPFLSEWQRSAPPPPQAASLAA